MYGSLTERIESESALERADPNKLLKGEKDEHVFYCGICLEEKLEDKSLLLGSCRYCEECVISFLRVKICDGQVDPICFYDTETDENVEVPEHTVKEIISAELYEKYSRFKFKKENLNARDCPYCDFLQVVETSEESAAVWCQSCGKEFCFVHSNAHEGISCEQYERVIAEERAINEAAINEITKECPGCKNRIGKSEGCNQMKCFLCNTNFCWLCGAEVDSGIFPQHFQWWNLKGCPGNQMTDSESVDGKCMIFLKNFGRILFIVFVGPPAFVLSIFWSLLCCCFLPFNDSTWVESFLNAFCFSGYCILAPFFIALVLLFLPCLLVICWFSRDEITEEMRRELMNFNLANIDSADDGDGHNSTPYSYV